MRMNPTQGATGFNLNHLRTLQQKITTISMLYDKRLPQSDWKYQNAATNQLYMGYSIDGVDLPTTPFTNPRHIRQVRLPTSEADAPDTPLTVEVWHPVNYKYPGEDRDTLRGCYICGDADHYTTHHPQTGRTPDQYPEDANTFTQRQQESRQPFHTTLLEAFSRNRQNVPPPLLMHQPPHLHLLNTIRQHVNRRVPPPTQARRVEVNYHPSSSPTSRSEIQDEVADEPRRNTRQNNRRNARQTRQVMFATQGSRPPTRNVPPHLSLANNTPLGCPPRQANRPHFNRQGEDSPITFDYDDEARHNMST